MTRIHPPLGVAALVLAATCLYGATPAPGARITLVEHSSAPGARAGADPSIARRALPGGSIQEAHVFAQTIQVGTTTTEIVEVAFHATTSVTTIQASNDFHVVPGGTCQENRVYNAGESCTVDVMFKGMGPGHRAGQLKFATSESVQPETLGLQGTTLGAALAFTPALITTLPQSVVNGKPLLYAPGDITVDQGDNLYFTDQFLGSSTSSGGLYFIDGSQNLDLLAGGGSIKLTSSNTWNEAIAGNQTFLQQPYGVTVDPYLNVFVAEYGNNAVDLERIGTTQIYAGLGTGSAGGCVTLTDCYALGIGFANPLYIKSDQSGNIYFNDLDAYYEMPAATPLTQANGQQTVETFMSAYYNGIAPTSFALDNEDNVYSTRFGTCQVEGWNTTSIYQWAVAGSGICGYAANNVRAQNAEVGDAQYGMAFDAAGDLYFADSTNNVLRRVDNYNGFIRTVGGNFALGANYTGDGGPATAATLNYPAGVAVDSNGVIYTISLIAGATPAQELVAKGVTGPVADTSSAEAKPELCKSGCGASPLAVIRKIGPQGQLNFPATLEGHSSQVGTILLTNVGNDNLVVSSSILGGNNPTSFQIIPASSSCTWGTGTPLPPGESCQLGYQCVPKAAGQLTATVTLVDNTATFANTINLGCYGVAAPVTPTVVVNPPTPSASSPYLTAVPITVTVTNTIPGTPPTGTVTLTITNLTTSTVYTTTAPIGLTHGNFATFSTATYTLPSSANLKVGNYSIVASYSGDTFDTTATSAADPFSVTPVAPTVTWAATSPVTAGSSLSAAQLDAKLTYNGAIVPGTLVYTVSPSPTTVCTAAQTTSANPCTPSPAVPLNTAGQVTLNLVFTPTDTLDYDTATASTSITVQQLPPTLTWATPAWVYVGTSLGSTQFNAQATYNSVNLPGTYAYSIVFNSVTTTLCANLNVAPACTSPYVTTSAEGGQSVALEVLFTPTNTVTYTNAAEVVTLNVQSPITVVPVKTSTGLSSAKNPAAEGDTLELRTVVQSTTGSTAPTGTVTLLEGNTVLAKGNLTGGASNIPLKGLSAGPHVLTAAYSGDSSHVASTSQPLQQLVVTLDVNPVRSDPHKIQ